MLHILLLSINSLNQTHTAVTRRLGRLKIYGTFLNIAKYFKTLRCGCDVVVFIFSIYLKPVLYFGSFFICKRLKRHAFQDHVLHACMYKAFRPT